MPARILLVDDSPTILSMLGLLLRQQGYEVLTAKDGLDALAKLGQQAVDLVVTDVNMPRMDGFTLISTIRSQQSSRRIPIIVLSTEASPKDQQAGLSRGADLYLTKPVRPADLVAHVRSLLS